MRTERYELRDDPCAAGKWRGGIGMVRVNRFLEDTIVVLRGRPRRGRPAVGDLRRPRRHQSPTARSPPPDGTVEYWPSKFTGKTLPAGSTIEIAVPNSGGYGDPLERDPEQVLSDVLDGFTTIELAERDYGVSIDPDTMSVDAGRTAELRGQAVTQ